MELDILKHFIGHDVEVLISGVWIEGHMQPIAKGIIVLLPIAGAEAFYGPTSCKADVIQAIRQVKRDKTTPQLPPEPQPTKIKSSFDATPGKNFVVTDVRKR
jgi:hypothetical protein